MALLSILTPTYNRAGCLATLFKSLCAQTNLDFEWWIVDDGSTDYSGSILMQEETEKVSNDWENVYE